VIELNRRLGFQPLETSTALQINWPVLPKSQLKIISDKTEIERRLGGRDLQIFRDHRDSPAAQHLVVANGQGLCYVIGRRDRRKRLPLFVSVLYVSNAELFRSASRHVARHFFVHTGALATLLEKQIAGDPPAGSISLRHPRLKMFKSAHLGPADIDYLYSELTQIKW
jgi:hypothetical protein